MKEVLSGVEKFSSNQMIKNIQKQKSRCFVTFFKISGKPLLLHLFHENFVFEVRNAIKNQLFLVIRIANKPE